MILYCAWCLMEDEQEVVAITVRNGTACCRDHARPFFVHETGSP